ncbi:uncharacterized protein LOC110448653 isoform X1 [Mizuhopecten yessoensis]|uniref:uncharacterized protein LOC110448653 isoform X1 n=1 Tax=Mizuhopecten yessoensis TaxID=6573 RepID=UPI000B45A16C|nr:uncharacterized protein LOC110448653 isoform X1 [Mizuhopecten yessoensis]
MFASAGKRKYPFLNQEICHQAANVQHRILTDSQHFLPKRVCIGNQLESSNQVRLTTIREEIYNSMQMNRTNTAVNQHQTTHIGQTTDNCSMETSPEEQHYVNNNLNNNSMCEGNRQQSVRCTRCEAGQGGHFQHIFQ